MTSSRLEISDISKYFDRKLAIKDVSLTLESNQVLGIFGPNGAGKTTLFSMIVGDLIPTSGSIFLNGEDITMLKPYQRARLGLGYLPQESSIFRGLTVEQNIYGVLELYEGDRHQRVQDLEYLLAKFDIARLRHEKGYYLSGGEKRRVEIARALAAKPKFLLLDEPLAAVDPITIQGIKMLIKELTEMNIGIIITDHNVKETLDIVDKVYIIHNHKILVSGTPDEVMNNPDVKKYYLGT